MTRRIAFTALRAVALFHSSGETARLEKSFTVALAGVGNSRADAREAKFLETLEFWR